VDAANADHRVRGVVLMICAMLFIPGIDAIAKLLADRVPAVQISWSRFFFQTLYIAPIILLTIGPAAMRAKNPPVVILRGVLIAAATLFFFTSLRYLPLAEAIAIFFVEPLLLTVLSAIFLRERIGWRRILAVIVGLGGAQLIIQPSFAEVGWPALLPLGAAATFAVYLLLTKTLAASERPLTLHLWAGIAGTAALGIAMGVGVVTGVESFTPVWPSAGDWLFLALLGAIATAAHFLVVIAFGLAPASLLAPFQYLEIVSATLLGYLIFNDFPGPQTWAGIAIIIGAGGFVLWRERVRAEGA
ncbi:MAG: DMT family transporter, partial [Pseudomonadota bacterium]